MTLKILAIPGSLREKSSSNQLLEVIGTNVPSHITFSVFDGVGSLPHFDDPAQEPAVVSDFKKRLREADGILICTPEYAFGVPGSLKNALDWVVSSGEFIDKPTALITASTSGEHGHKALLLILQAISAFIPESCALLIPGIRSKMNAQGQLQHEQTSQDIQNLINSFIKSIESTPVKAASE
jgi:chromate reductase, NAD(P)H dehydrogenase (quinone)